MEASCLELALEGERLSKHGDYCSGISFFEAALQVGTDDLQVLSAIYSQLGNAYFHTADYAKALEYHRHDLTLTRTVGDLLGEAKASGNLGNTLKVLGQFDEAAVCCQRQLDISRDLNDKVGQGKALYNIGNVYHAKGRRICWSGTDPGEVPEEGTAALQKAAEFYEANLALVNELGDRAAQGRTYGNLGNTLYMMGNFQNAVLAHEQRLRIAKEFGDRAAERRAYCNLGNAYIFLGEFETAAVHYKRTLQLARQLRDQAVEAQACYSLGNVYTLLQDYGKAIEYHHKHLVIAQDLGDRIGEGRACWSLGNTYTALGNHDQAMHFAEKHLAISREIGDKSGELTARMNVSDLQAALGLTHSGNNSLLPENHVTANDHGAKQGMGRRHSMENMELVKLSSDNINGQKLSNAILSKQPKNILNKTPSKLSFIDRLRGIKHKNSGACMKVPQVTSNTADGPQVAVEAQRPGSHSNRASLDMLGDEGFFDLLSRFQSTRMDDQRCTIQDEMTLPTDLSRTAVSRILKKSHSTPEASPHCVEIPGAVARPQGRCLDGQQLNAGGYLGLQFNQQNRRSVLGRLIANADNKAPEEDFLDMLVKCQGSRIDDQRCAAPLLPPKGPTVPDEDFFSLILRSQAKRMDEQRVALSPGSKRPN